MKLAEARAVCADLHFRECDEDLYTNLQKELIQRLVQASPQVSGLDCGIFLLDAGGLTYLGGESKFCRQVEKIIHTVGFADTHIGIADTAFAAQVASKFKRGRQYIVQPGKDREFLSALSLAHMPVSPQMQETLLQLGIKTIGQLLQIPPDELQERFGREGLLALDLAGAIDRTQVQMVQAEEVYESSADLSFPVDSFEQTQFILKSMLERVCAQLKENDLLAEELLISFFNDNDKFDERPLRLMRPFGNVKFLLEIIKLSLAANPLAREFTAVNIRVSRVRPENWQQNKMRIVGSTQQNLSPVPSTDDNSRSAPVLEKISRGQTTSFVSESNSSSQSEPFMLLLQRFITRLGARAVVRSVFSDQHMPDMSARFLPLVEEADAVLPININFNLTGSTSSVLACGLVLRKSQTPEPVLVEYQGKIPTAVTYQGRWHKIKELTEPERLSGLWWENPVRKSYYVALLEACNQHLCASRSSGEKRRTEPAVVCDSYLVLLVHDHNNNSWQLDGFFD